jgi:hypothetical protein
MKALTLGLAVSLALLFTACSTTDSRIRERSVTFAALDPATQDRLRLGRVDLGDTADMVYIAIGRPTKMIDRITNQERESTWVYTSFYEEYAGTRTAGFRRTVIEDKDTKRSFIRVEPVYRDIYLQRAEDYIRLIFRAGIVSAIEQTKNG